MIICCFRQENLSRIDAKVFTLVPSATLGCRTTCRVVWSVFIVAKGRQTRPTRLEYYHDLEISHNNMMFLTGKICQESIPQCWLKCNHIHNDPWWHIGLYGAFHCGYKLPNKINSSRILTWSGKHPKIHDVFNQKRIKNWSQSVHFGAIISTPIHDDM